ncbi:hypothetical protein G647_06855 [Cladophialophora carrionii CBS 160.54]|uniref:Uncharacterized protein n=1 Tax=Cladophialophora carrionii CBS 160.54 TaxID=1279043 RepID=V9D777_9EURO|nr:uncharacterized protein G647_06855 [Cladophialophora carrionii CBS 160.54]ETI22779.1 hypothetical protein G647_06855 [Cladophialophora carrionii CBS 160.54]
MPANGSHRRFDRSRIAPVKGEHNERSEWFHRPQHVKRQGEAPPLSAPVPTPPAPVPQSGPPPYLPPGPPSTLRLPPGTPENNFTPEDDSSDDDELDSESEDEGGIDSDDEDDGVGENPFVPATETATQSQPSIAAATTTSTIPSEPTSATDSVATSTPGAFFTPSSGPTTTGLASVTASTSSIGSTTTSDIPAAPVSTSNVATIDLPQASNHPIAKTAIIVPSVIGSVAAIAAVYLLFRYCVPLRARWTIYRARRGQRLPEEEDGMSPTTAPEMTEAYATKTAAEASHESLGHERSNPSTPITQIPSFTNGTAVALPITNARAPPPVLVRNLSKSNAQNPLLLSQPALSRSNSGTRAGAPPEDYGTYASNFNLSDYAASHTPEPGHQRHPSGLENNPPTPVAAKGPGLSNQNKGAAMPVIPSVVGSAESEVGTTFPRPPSTPSAAHFGPKTPPESEVNYSPRRLRKSITPSESVSNIPDSPFPPSPGLMPPMPVLNSRWSADSSSVNGHGHGRALAEAMNMGPVQDGDLGTAPNGRPLFRYLSLPSGSSAVHHGASRRPTS